MFGGEEIKEEDVRWAISAFESRRLALLGNSERFDYKDKLNHKYALIPFVDMFNHLPSSSSCLLQGKNLPLEYSGEEVRSLFPFP